MLVLVSVGVKLILTVDRRIQFAVVILAMHDAMKAPISAKQDIIAMVVRVRQDVRGMATVVRANTAVAVHVLLPALILRVPLAVTVTCKSQSSA